MSLWFSDNPQEKVRSKYYVEEKSIQITKTGTNLTTVRLKSTSIRI